MARADGCGWSFLARMRGELRESIRVGAALAGVVAVAGCGAKSEDAATNGPDATAGTSGTAPADLDPVPTEMLGCAGPTHDDDFGYHGQCCFRQRCYQPAPGASCSEDLTADEVVAFVPSGSGGKCVCSLEGRDSVSGPFAPNSSGNAPPDSVQSTPEPEGSCCYVVASINCDGRPFVVNDAQRVAAWAWRDDWGLSA